MDRSADAAYEPVSQPATHRDMSIGVADPDMELLGERIRDVLGEPAGWVVNVELLQTCDYASVPAKARHRLGMSPVQHNLLIPGCSALSRKQHLKATGKPGL